MKPLEINQKIAELKGFKRFGEKLPDRDNLIEPVYATDFNEIIDQNKNWAENIADAWELFEEIPYKISVGKYEKKNYFIAKWEHAFTVEPNIITESKTAPIAICLAWINWKEKNA